MNKIFITLRAEENQSRVPFPPHLLTEVYDSQVTMQNSQKEHRETPLPSANRQFVDPLPNPRMMDFKKVWRFHISYSNLF